jgi:hypothetical protein
MRSTLLLASVAGVLSACSFPHPTPLAEPERFVLTAPADSVFRAGVGALVKWNFVIAFADKSSGVISTAPRMVSGPDSLSAVLYPATNCQRGAIGPFGGISDYRVRVSIALEDLGDSTAFRISTGITARWVDYLDNDDDDHPPVTTCASAGPFERSLAQEMGRALGR